MVGGASSIIEAGKRGDKIRGLQRGNPEGVCICVRVCAYVKTCSFSKSVVHN